MLHIYYLENAMIEYPNLRCYHENSDWKISGHLGCNIGDDIKLVDKKSKSPIYWIVNMIE